MDIPNSTYASTLAMQPEHAGLKVLWEDEMKAVNKYVHHKSVFALLLFWENKPGWSDMMSTEQEVDRLVAVLQNVYKFQTQKQIFRQTKVHVQTQMNKYLSDFAHEFGHEDDTLLIIYYAGHGWALPGGRGSLQLAGKTNPNMTRKEKENVSINWNDSEHIIQNTNADVLLILDCCDSGTLSPTDRVHNRRFELLAACGHDKTTSFPGRFSFTSALIWALEQLAKENPFSTCKLRLKIKEAPLFAANSPYAVNQIQDPVLCSRFRNSNRLASDEHIMIEVLGQGEEYSSGIKGTSKADDKHGDYVDFRFHFKGTFDTDELKVAAREMKRLMKESELSLDRIGFLRHGNTLQQAASAFLHVARRRKGSLGPKSPLTQSTPDGILETQPDSEHSAHTGSSEPKLIAPVPGSPTGTNKDSERSLSSLPTNDDTYDHGYYHSIRFHFQEMLKGILFLGLGWLQGPRSIEPPRNQNMTPQP